MNQTLDSTEKSSTLDKLGNVVAGVGRSIRDSAKSVLADGEDKSGDEETGNEDDYGNNEESGDEEESVDNEAVTDEKLDDTSTTSQFIAFMNKQQDTIDRLLMDMSNKLDTFLQKNTQDVANMQPPAQNVFQPETKAIQTRDETQLNDTILLENGEVQPGDETQLNAKSQPVIKPQPNSNGFPIMGGKTMGRRNRRRKTKRKVVR